ncbi:MAG: hypothetical protein ABI790_09885 [Betaproteobacteria bacterium]
MKENLSRQFFIALFLGIPFALSMQLANSQTVGANIGSASAPSTVQTANTASLVVHDEPYALFDGLVRELRNGGYVLFLRHGVVLPSTTDQRGPGAWWQDCQSTQRLAPEAQPRVRAFAEALVRQRISVYAVHTSEFCRAADTAAHFGLIPARRSPALNDVSALPDIQAATLGKYAAGIQALLSDVMPPKVNRVLVGHSLPPKIVHPALNYLPEGNVAIFKAEGNGRFHYLTSVSPGQWQWIGKQMVQDQINALLAQNLAGSPQVAPAVPPTPSQVLIAPGKGTQGSAPCAGPAAWRIQFIHAARPINRRPGWQLAANAILVGKLCDPAQHV